MQFIMIFFLGIANFAIHSAMLNARHPAMEGLREIFRMMGGPWISYLVEYVILLTALSYVSNHVGWIVPAYVLYTIANGFAAWLFISRKI